MLIQIDDRTIYNTETGDVIENVPGGEVFLDSWDKENKQRNRLEGSEATRAWEPSCW